MNSVMMLGLVMFASVVVAAKVDKEVIPMSPVPVTVYYESLCPDSAKFVTKQLFPAFETFGTKNMDLTLVPFGKSKYVKTENNSYNFDCHHGPNECFGNKVHACALAHLATVTDRVTYVNCLMDSVKLDKKDTPDKYPGQKCATKLNLSYFEINGCVNSTEGDLELVKMGDKTNAFQARLESVPTVVFNMTYNKKDNEKAQKDFNSVFCSYLGGPSAHNKCKNSAISNQAPILFVVMAATILKFIS